MRVIVTKIIFFSFQAQVHNLQAHQVLLCDQPLESETETSVNWEDLNI
jgi:hypothetical protein